MIGSDGIGHLAVLVRREEEASKHRESKIVSVCLFGRVLATRWSHTTCPFLSEGRKTNPASRHSRDIQAHVWRSGARNGAERQNDLQFGDFVQSPLWPPGWSQGGRNWFRHRCLVLVINATLSWEKVPLGSRSGGVKWRATNCDSIPPSGQLWTHKPPQSPNRHVKAPCCWLFRASTSPHPGGYRQSLNRFALRSFFRGDRMWFLL